MSPRRWLEVLIAGATLMSAISLAQSREPAIYRLTIASQPLSDALQEFARQSGVQVIFFSEVTEGLRAPTLEGRYTMAAALTALLGNSRLTFRIINAKTVQIRAPADARTDKARASRMSPSDAVGDFSIWSALQ